MTEGKSDSIEGKTREIRLGLVMYGGVSLAIYINGVAHELFRAVRGRGTYRLLKALTDSDVVVDVLSGTSAGGINGILLAYALCNQREFGGTAALWRKHGDIGRLLRGTDDPPESYRSLLNSEDYYEPRLREAFEDLGKATLAADVAEDPSRVDELDLFVTGTDFHGRVWTTVDDRGSAIQIKDHRTVFWLKHRAGRKTPFHVDADAEDRLPDARPPDGSHTHDALARLARITSCFPGAFAPVVVGGESAVDRRLRRWGAVDGTDDRVYIDGGVLDNKPFSTTLGAIYSRTADRPVDRWLLYVEPDPERFAAEHARVEAPGIVATALQSLTAIPGYESIADDLRSLRQHNDRIMRVQAILGGLERNPSSFGDQESYLRVRLAGLCERIFAALFGLGLGRSAIDGQATAARAALRSWYMEHVVHAQDDVRARYLDMDVEYRLRRLMHVTYAHERDLMKPEMRGFVRLLNRQIQALEIVRSAMEGGIEAIATKALCELPSPVDQAWAAAVWTDIGAGMAAVLAVAPPAGYTAQPAPGLPDSNVDPLDRILDAAELKDLADRLLGKRSPAVYARAGSPGLLQAADLFERKLFALHPELQKTYEGFAAIDRTLHPLEVVSEMRERDVIQTLRVSPVDAQVGLSDRTMDEKVCGQRFSHFGAFFKRSWRSNDILWGRLDGACQLVQLLIGEPERIAAVIASKGDRIAALIGELAADTGALPLPEPQRSRLFEFLGDLCSDDDDRRNGALARLREPVATGSPIELLVLAAQFEALAEDLPSVIVDAASEQLSWNQYPRWCDDPEWVDHAVHATAAAVKVDGRPLTFIAGQGTIDPMVIATTTAAVAHRAAQDTLADSDRRHRFFRDTYAIGRETMRDIPRLVLLETFTRGLIVARNALLASLGDRAELVRGHPIYQVFVGWPLRVLLALVTTLRRAPALEGAFIGFSLIYIALSAVVIFWNKAAIYDSEEGFSKMGAALFIGMPLLLVVAVRLLVASRDGSRRLVWSLRVLGWAAGLAGLVLTVPIVAHVLQMDPLQQCREGLGPKLEALLCRTWLAEGFHAATWAVVVSAALGALWTAGIFGIVSRALRRGEARLWRWLKERKRPRAP